MTLRLKILLVLLLLASCKNRNGTKLSDSGTLNREGWVDKASLHLRGVGLGPQENMSELLQKSDEDILEYFMNDPKFDAVMIFFGAKFYGRALTFDPNQSLSSGEASRVPQALAAAKAVRDGRNFFELVSDAPSILVTSIAPPGNFATLPPDITPADIPNYSQMVREARRQAMQSQLTTIDAIVKKFSSNKESMCNALPVLIPSQNFGSFANLLSGSGLGSIGQLLSDTWAARIERKCQNEAASANDIAQLLLELKQGIEVIHKSMEPYTEAKRFLTLAESISIQLRLPNLGPILGPFSGRAKDTWGFLTNSSTNINRKRGAYILRTLFCDDLIPLDVPASKAMQHAKGKHATAPECLACHYKLDPMAGLFRHYGLRGNYMKDAKVFTFDDQKTLNKEEYTKYLEENWGSDAKGGMKVGYYTAPDVRHPDWRGDDLEDLWAFAEKSSDVRQCVVKRLAEFFLGEGQVYDKEWLNEISHDLVPGPTSGQAARKFIKQLVMSKTFKVLDPERGECFDIPKQRTTASPLPCAVRSVLESKCLGCHSNLTNNLDLSSWQNRADGKPWFAHVSDEKQPIGRTQSAEIMMSRIKSAEDGVRMPPNGAIHDTERQVIYTWLNEAKL